MLSQGDTPQVSEWQIFNRVPGAQAIADGLKDIPADWSLTPIQDKQPKRDGWQDEPFIPHSVIADLILQGERKISKSTGKQYTAYYSGFGLRTGEQSGGLVAIDIDGPSAEPLLQRMSGGDLPVTPGWTSGKPGRRQIVFQVPDEIRPLIAGFGRAVVTEFEDLKTAEGELLEFRYSNHQSCLPPSRHPQTGSYRWDNSPSDVPVAIAPPWLCAKLIEFANHECQESERKRLQHEERLRQAEERRRQRQLNTIGVVSLEDVLEECRKRLHAEDIYNWPGHNWHYRGKTLQGCCPRHRSNSGKSLHVDTETLKWFCFGCNVGGDLVQYRYFAQGGNGTPEGRDFVEILRGLASDAGVQMPELPQSESDREPDDAAYEEYLAWEVEQERVDNLAADFERERRKREWHERLWRELNPPLDAYVWGQSYQEAPSPQSLWELKYKPNKTVHQRYLNLEGIDTSFLCLVSAMNTGKTQSLVDSTSNPEDSLLIVTHTVALAEALAVRYNTRCYNEDDINLGEVNRLAITADSLWKIPTLNKRFKYVVIDEADQVTTHLSNGGTCKRNRGRILASFAYFAGIAEHYILADADLSGTVIDWHAHTRKRSPFVLKNTYKPCEGRIAYQFSSQVALFEYGCQLLEEGKRVLFATDAKSTVKKAASRLTGVRTIEGIENLEEEVYQKLESRFPNKKGRQIHGDNSNEADVRAFIKNINNSLKYIPLDYVVYNSSMGSGISIDVEAFDAVIVLASGYTLPHTELGQLAHRYRPTTEFCFWVNGDGLKGLETNCYRVASDFLYKNRASGLSLQIDPNTGMVGINNPDFLALVASLEARRNWSLMNIAATFTGHLAKMGYRIEPHPDEDLLTELDDATEKLKEHKRVVEAAEKASICKAIELTPEQYEGLKNSPTTDFHERCALQKYELHEFYGREVTEELIDQDDAGSLRRSLTRLDMLLNSEAVARRMDLSDRRSHHVITDLKHYKLQRDLLSDLGLLEFIDPAKEYHAHDLIALGERARLKAIDIKKILSITISVAPRRLRECRIHAHKGIKALFTPATSFADKWLIFGLANGTAQKFAAKKFADQEQANEYCSQLSPAAKLICEAIAVEKRFAALEATDSQVHAALCGAVGLKRKKTRQSKKEGRFYQIVPETWKFAAEVLDHRQEQRDQRLLAREEELQEEARRFDHMEPEQIQAEIEAEIAAVKSSEAPALVFLAEQWIKFAADLGNSGRADSPATPLDAPALILLLEWWIKITDILEKSNSGNTPPRKMNFTNKPGGGVSKSRRVGPGDEVRVSHTTIPHCPIPELPNQTLIVEQQASGVTAESHEYHDYLKIKIPDGGSYWVPAEWLESLDGLPVRRDPDAYTTRIPTSTIRTWRYWLLGVRSPEELEQFECRRTPKELQAVVDSLAPDQLITLQHQLQEWGITRDWLLMAAPGNEHLPQEIGEWLEACVDLGDDAAPGALSEAVESLRTQAWFSTARSHIWSCLSAQIKAAIVRLSFNSYQILAGVS